MTIGGGWPCPRCEGHVYPGVSHACLVLGGTVPPIAPFPTYSAKPVRYRIHGEVGSQCRTYQVDLVVEAKP